MRTYSLNFRELESRLNELVIDLHDAARMTSAVDSGVSVRLRLIAGELNEVVTHVRGLLASDADSAFGDDV